MSTQKNNQQNTSRFLGLRITPQLWQRLSIAVVKANSTVKAFVTEALEKHLDLAERKQAPDDLNGQSARAAIREMRKRSGS